mmetsp:Transcript_2219/g.5630  ORF Transcript_2219/g.5630 Transcript_2219/m.5630 type:complete len:131 (-) Transcript_2219:296-688(-)
MAKLAEQLCCPDTRVNPVQDGPRASPRKKPAAGTATSISKSAASSTSSPYLTEKRLRAVREEYKMAASKHLPTLEPLEGKGAKLNCQMCMREAKARGSRSQSNAVIMCCGCRHLVCGPTCWCALHHGITP